MTKYASETDPVPYGAIRFLVGNRHAATPAAEIAEEIAHRMNRAGATRAEVERGVDHALAEHQDNRDLCTTFRL
jgi:hypothetical protein